MQREKHNNGVRHPLELKERAQGLRRAGRTHREISKELGISLGSADLWTKGITITLEQKKDIQKRRDTKVWTPEFREKYRLLAKNNPRLHAFKYTADGILQEIRDFYALHNRIPLKREMNRRVFRYHFGTWNNAIIAAGFEPNPVLFAKRLVARDGHICDSFTERIIDDWLCDNDIVHERGVRYGLTKMTADFKIGQNTIVEFFGLAGVQKNYDRLLILKRKLSKDLGWHLIEVYPKDIFPKNKLSELLETSSDLRERVRRAQQGLAAGDMVSLSDLATKYGMTYL